MNFLVIKKVFVKFKIENPENIWIDEFVCLGSKVYSFRCAVDIKNILKGVSNSQSKHIKFEHHKECIDGD